MAYDMKPGQGSLFNNDKREKDSQPLLKGSVVLPDGTACWISAWKKETAAGEPWFSLSIQPKERQPAAAESFRRSGGASGGFPGQSDRSGQRGPDTFDDDVPF